MNVGDEVSVSDMIGKKIHDGVVVHASPTGVSVRVKLDNGSELSFRSSGGGYVWSWKTPRYALGKRGCFEGFG